MCWGILPGFFAYERLFYFAQPLYIPFLFAGSLVELMGVAKGNETVIASRENFTDLTRQLYVMPGQFVVYRVGLTSPQEEGEFHGKVFVTTEYEEQQVVFRFRVAKGSLSTQASQLSFDTAFPVSQRQVELVSESQICNK